MKIPMELEIEFTDINEGDVERQADIQVKIWPDRGTFHILKSKAYRSNGVWATGSDMNLVPFMLSYLKATDEVG